MKRQKLFTLLMVVFTIFSIFFSAITPTMAAPLVLSGDSGGDGSGDGTGASASSTTRIRFAKGGTSALVSGKLAAGGRVRYTLRAAAGQLMDVTLSGPDGMSLKVTGPAGRALTALEKSAESWRGYLPRTGDYTLEVRGSGSYSLFVSIPQRVSFKTGTTSAELSGKLAAQGTHEFILKAGAGQIMEIAVTPRSSVQLSVFGVDGTVLSSGSGSSSEGDGGGSPFFREKLPSSQDYVVTLRAGDAAVNYDINMIIPARISFTKGSFSTTLSGNLAAGHSQYYVLKARQSQSMDVKASAGKALELVIYGMDGTLLMEGEGKEARFTGELETTQDYIVVIRSVKAALSYSLRVKIK